MTYTLVQQKPRQTWTNLDWATYLCCPVKEISSIKKFLDDTFVMSIARHKNTGLYCFAMYKYDFAPSGATRLQLINSGKKSFQNVMDALRDANENIISQMEFTDFWAKAYNVPKRALQMMLIRE
jgi:hypothetical protein